MSSAKRRPRFPAVASSPTSKWISLPLATGKAREPGSVPVARVGSGLPSFGRRRKSSFIHLIFRKENQREKTLITPVIFY